MVAVMYRAGIPPSPHPRIIGIRRVRTAESIIGIANLLSRVIMVNDR